MDRPPHPPEPPGDLLENLVDWLASRNPEAHNQDCPLCRDESREVRQLITQGYLPEDLSFSFQEFLRARDRRRQERRHHPTANDNGCLEGSMEE